MDTAEVCLTVAIFDGFVMARSGFRHSTNYRQAMLLGTARKVSDPDEKETQLKAFVDGNFPGRRAVLRPPLAREMKATAVQGMPIREASSKARTGPPKDDEEDHALPIWAGVIPVCTNVLVPVPDSRNLEGVEPPAHVLSFRMG